LWNHHPEPSGSRRATPLLLFQHRAGQFPQRNVGELVSLAAAGPRPSRRGAPGGNGRGDHVEARGFAEFWGCYPKKEGLTAAQKAYAAALATGVTADVLIAKARQYAVAKAHHDPKWIKMTATWLKERCWLEDPQPPAPKKPREPRQATSTPAKPVSEEARRAAAIQAWHKLNATLAPGLRRLPPGNHALACAINALTLEERKALPSPEVLADMERVGLLGGGGCFALDEDSEDFNPCFGDDDDGEGKPCAAQQPPAPAPHDWMSEL
jgi:hypothetical protein